MTDKIDTSPEAVERLANEMQVHMSWRGANTLRALSARVAELEAKLEALDHAYDSIVQALCFEALRTDDAEAKLATAEEFAKLADDKLTNFQPKIANGLVHKDWIPVFDGYIDPVIEAARATLVKIQDG